MILLYLFSFFRTILIIIGVIFVLRLIGRMMIVKRNLEEQNKHQQNVRRSEQLKETSRRNFGKTTISNVGKDKIEDGDYVEYEEID